MIYCPTCGYATTATPRYISQKKHLREKQTSGWWHGVAAPDGQQTPTPHHRKESPMTDTPHHPAGTSHLADIAATLASIDRSLQTIAESLANPTPWNVTVQ